MVPQRPLINYRLRVKRLSAGMTEGQLAEAIARLVSAETGRGAAIDGNYISKLERGRITWPNSAYRRAFRMFFDATTDVELGFYAMRTRRDAQRWLPASGRAPASGTAPLPPAAKHSEGARGQREPAERDIAAAAAPVAPPAGSTAGTRIRQTTTQKRTNAA